MGRFAIRDTSARVVGPLLKRVWIVLVKDLLPNFAANLSTMGLSTLATFDVSLNTDVVLIGYITLPNPQKTKCLTTLTTSSNVSVSCAHIYSKLTKGFNICRQIFNSGVASFGKIYRIDLLDLVSNKV